MTKKQFVLTSLALMVILFILYWFYLPMEVGGQRPGNIFMQIFYVGFIAATTVMLVAFLFLGVLKKPYIVYQISIIKHFRHLLFLMIKRDFVTKYRRSILGVLWSILNPLLTMLVLSMVFSMLFRGFDVENFPIYVLSGQLIFNFYNESTTTAMNSVVMGAGTIKKVYIPKYIFPLSKVFSSMVNLGFSFIAFLIVFVATRASFHWTIFLIPIPILYLLLFSLGIGMLLSAMSVFFRDLTYIYGVFLTLLMFLTPIMYPVNILPSRIYHLLHLNPLFHYVNYFRDLALNGNIPGLWENIICLGFSLAALGVGLYVKISQQDKYILYL